MLIMRFLRKEIDKFIEDSSFGVHRHLFLSSDLPILLSLQIGKESMQLKLLPQRNVGHLFSGVVGLTSCTCRSSHADDFVNQVMGPGLGREHVGTILHIAIHLNLHC
eukprot:TRINITY_DN105738_c0_g1_i1.p1 TRINITY_DN105738_c0_g1~~TRINITY_DN105738_c0_g1_i1.p1  ORF type:complete len:107 (+),score=9.94 TRINITY_DN105738_c0_g1_i1:212-532(+)